VNANDQLIALGKRVADELLEKLPDARAVLVATEDGFELAYAMRDAIEPARLAAMTSSIAAIGDIASREAGIGQTRCFLLEASDGYLVMRSAQHRQFKLVLTALTRRDALLGMVMNAVNESSRALAA